MQTYINIALIILSITLVVAILLQTHGALGGVFGGDAMTGQYKTRRGLQKTIFQITIIFATAFFVVVIINVFLLNQ
jgi:preprotein translocase subunit SecG